ncbi:MAG: NAD(+)/NADH kinase, partial [Stackebrandtia sp.]
MKTVGLLVNPVAGLGGTVGLHGTDGRELADRALARGAVPRATDRAVMALSELAERTSGFRLLTVSGAMGSCAVAGAGLSATVVYSACDPTGPGDTVAAAVALAEAGCDLLLFAGGDGTARDLLTARPPSAPPTPKPNPAGPATARTKPGPAAAAGPSDPTPASPTPAGPSDGPATTGPLAPLAAGSSGGPTVTGPLAIPGPAEFPYEQSPAGPSGGSVATGPLVAASSAGPTVTQASSGPPFTGRPTSAAESVATATGPSTTLPGPAESRCGPGPDGALDGQAVAGSLAGMMVIGIPAGVKIHSAVYAVNPRAAGEVAAAYCDGTVRSRMAEVLDRPPGSGTGTVLYGHLPVPALPHRVQLGKIGSTST